MDESCARQRLKASRRSLAALVTAGETYALMGSEHRLSRFNENVVLFCVLENALFTLRIGAGQLVIYFGAMSRVPVPRGSKLQRVPWAPF